MTARHADTIIEGYLKRLDGELADLPTGRRKEVSGQIAEHIAEARSQLTDETDADVLTILDRLGDPEDIAAEARARFEVPADRPGLVEMLALMLLLAGGIVLSFPPIAWLAGIALVWRSRSWSPRTKYFGAYAPFVAALGLIAVSALVGALLSGLVLAAAFGVGLLVLIAFPIGSGIFLATRLRRRLPILGWVAIAIVCVGVYVPAGSVFDPPTESAFVAGEAGGSAPGCGGFYGTLHFSPHTPLVARVPVSVGICWDGVQVKKTWGPDCPPEYGLGEIVSVEWCTATSMPDGSLNIGVEATEKPLTSLTGEVSHTAFWRVTPDGHIEQIF